MRICQACQGRRNAAASPAKVAERECNKGEQGRGIVKYLEDAIHSRDKFAMSSACKVRQLECKSRIIMLYEKYPQAAYTCAIYSTPYTYQNHVEDKKMENSSPTDGQLNCKAY